MDSRDCGVFTDWFSFYNEQNRQRRDSEEKEEKRKLQSWSYQVGGAIQNKSTWTSQWVGAVAQWKILCMACRRPHVQPQASLVKRPRP